MRAPASAPRAGWLLALAWLSAAAAAAVRPLSTRAAATVRPLSALVPGEAIAGIVVSCHKDKLFLRVPVERTGRLAGTPIAAQLKLPMEHPMIKRPMIGAGLTVYVKRTDAGHLRVGLQPPRPPPRTTPPIGDFLRLEELQPGDELRGTVLSAADCGVFVDAGVWRRGRHDSWRPVLALVPLDQLEVESGKEVGVDEAELLLGQQLCARVLDAKVSSGSLLLTARSGAIGEIVEALRQRRNFARTRSRRPSVASLAVGTVREGVVERVEAFGLIVNVGAKRSGLVHVSDLGAGFVEGVDAVALVAVEGDAVMVEVLPSPKAGEKGGRSEGRLRLKFVQKIAKTGEAVEASTLATARRGEVVRQRFTRVEDARVRRAAAAESWVASRPLAAKSGRASPAGGSVTVPQRAKPGQGAADERPEVKPGGKPVMAPGGAAAREVAVAREAEEDEEDEDEDDDDGSSDWEDEDYFADKYEASTY